jgi:hypothetical protein
MTFLRNELQWAEDDVDLIASMKDRRRQKFQQMNDVEGDVSSNYYAVKLARIVMMNDEGSWDYAVLTVPQLYAINIERVLKLRPNGERKWTRCVPSKRH